MHLWPQVITSTLCSFAISVSVDTYNKFKKDDSDFSPLERFTGMTQPIVPRGLHPFGYPAFVLSADLQDHKKLPRWDEQVRAGAYLGRSKKHSSSVALILSLQTCHVSPQFHVVLDDDFETVDSLRRGVEPSRWKWLPKHRREFHLDDNNSMIDNSRTWTDTELESSILFEVTQEPNQ